jgi:hypothetical protein
MKDKLIQALVTKDQSRGRSTQVNVGPSEIGGCARRLWYRINRVEETNPNTLRLAAIMGTAIHTEIEKAMSGQEGIELEVEVEWNGTMGHIDCIDVASGAIWDWKTTTKSGLSYFPSKQYIEQIHIYAYIANKNGYDIKTVGLVALCRDGNELDIREHSEPYDEQIALESLARLQRIKEMFEPPAPEKEVSFCSKYCPFFGDDCQGKERGGVTDLITNDEVAEAAQQYFDIARSLKDLESRQKALKPLLEGTNGITVEGVVVKWSEVVGRQSIDESEVEKLLGFVPKKQGEGYSTLRVSKK